MIEIGAVEKSILGALLFPEPFSTLVEECETFGNPKFLWSVLKELIQHGYVKALHRDSKLEEYVRVDNPNGQLFRSTAKGISILEY
ncbi:MAG: hypothetical protein VXX63_07200 [Bacteroidota bacterium]|nr:hypothetical protein [Bacteroidota bacterium]